MENIKPGYYKTRSGSKARVLCTDAPGDYPLVGYVCDSHRRIDTLQWDENGKYVGSEDNCSVDLEEEWDETVSFQEALEAMDNGKTVESVYSIHYSLSKCGNLQRKLTGETTWSPHDGFWFSEITSKWRILESPTLNLPVK